jgi:hypothetical protein
MSNVTPKKRTMEPHAASSEPLTKSVAKAADSVWTNVALVLSSM